MEKTVEQIFTEELKKLLVNVRSIGSLYVEPGDVVILSVSPETEHNELQKLQQIFSQVLNQNPGVLVQNGSVEFKVIRKGESHGYEKEEIENLKEQIKNLEEKVTQGLSCYCKSIGNKKDGKGCP